MKYLLYLLYIMFFYSISFFYKVVSKQKYFVTEIYSRSDFYLNLILSIISFSILLYLISFKLKDKLEHICFLMTISGLIGFYTTNDIYSTFVFIIGLSICFFIIIKKILETE